MKISLKHRKRFLKNNKGFTLVELLVVFFIMASILAMVIPGYLEYSTQLELENLALDVALTIREAQAYGAGAKVSLAGNFDTPYGVYFDINVPNSFVFFEDRNLDSYYTLGTDAIINTYTMKNGYLLDDLCAEVGGNPYVCVTGGIRAINIVYKRPNPDSIISMIDSSGNPFGGWQDDVLIELISPDQTTIKVNVSGNGSVSLE